MSKMTVMQKAAGLLPILLVTAFSSSPVSAASLLGTATLNAEALAKTCFDSSCTTNDVLNGNTSVTSPDSAAQTTSNLSKIPSISVRGESDLLPAGGSAPVSFTSISSANVSLNYFFEIVGSSNNTTVPVTVVANGNISVTGNFASTGYLSYVSEARAILPDGTHDIFIDGGAIGPNQVQTKSNSFSVNGTFDLRTNTAYQILLQVEVGTDLNQQSTTTALADLIATASIDPSFTIDPAFANDYTIIFSDGIGDAAADAGAAPLPATLPLFAGGLGFLGYLTRRKRRTK